MSECVSTFKENVLNGYYQQHKQGDKLFDIDIQAVCQTRSQAYDALLDENRGLIVDNEQLVRENEELKARLNALSEMASNNNETTK